MTKKQIYNNILWVGLAVVLIFSPLAFGAVRLWSITLVEIGVLILVFFWLWRANNRQEEFRRTKLDLPLWLFVTLAGISGAFSIYKYASFLEIMRLLTMAGGFYLIVNNFDRWMSLRLVSLVIIVGTGLSGLGLAQYFWGLEHSWWKPNEFLASTYVNHNHFAGYLELAIPLAICMLLSKRTDNRVQRTDMIKKIMLGVSILLMLAAFLFSQSRGAWASLTIALLAMNAILIKREVLKRQSVVIFILFITLGAVFIYAGHDDLAKRLRSAEQMNDESFMRSRIKIWRGTVNMIKDNPLYGTGLGTFVWGFPRYRPEGLNIRAHYAHNDYLHMMAEMGLLALPLLLWMIWIVVAQGFSWQDRVAPAKALDRLQSKTRFGLMEAVVLGSAVGILSLALHGLVDFNFHITANMLVVAVLAGIIMRRA